MNYTYTVLVTSTTERLQFGPVNGFTAGGFGDVNDNKDVIVDLIATRSAEDRWHLMGATSLAQTKQTFMVRIRRSIGVEAARAKETTLSSFLRVAMTRKTRTREIGVRLGNSIYRIHRSFKR